MYARKQYFIKKGLQTRFIWTILLIIFLVFVIISCNLFFFATYLQSELEGEQISQLKAVSELVYDKLWDKIVLLAVVNVFIIVIISLFFSHQIAGPVYKLEITLKRIIDGDILQRLFFRKTDKLDDLATLFNDAFGSITAPLVTLEEGMDVLEEKVGNDPEAMEILAKIKAEMENFTLRDEVPAEDCDSDEEQTETASVKGEEVESKDNQAG
jgi:methyl-accepting chemotaxis protein